MRDDHDQAPVYVQNRVRYVIEPERLKRWYRISAILFLATCVTTWIAGFFISPFNEAGEVHFLGAFK